MSEEQESITLRLSEVVFNYPQLYDSRHADFGNKIMRDEVWEDIGSQLNLPGIKVKKKWKNLRDSYIKYLRNLDKSSLTRRNSYAKWQWSSQMEKYKSFLFNSDIGTYKPRNTKMYLFADQDLSSELETDRPTESLVTVTKREPDPLDFLEESEEETQYPQALLKQSFDTVQSSTDEGPPRKVRRTEPLCNFGEVAECSNPNNAGELDVVDHLMLAYAKTIKRFSLRRQAETKMQIAQLILRQELEEIEERQERGNITGCTQL